MISQALIEELQQIVREEYGVDLSMADVKELAKVLVNSFSVLLDADESLLSVDILSLPVR